MSFARIKKILFLLHLLVYWNLSVAQNGFKFHKVQPGETVYSICRFYGISPDDFYKYNPETRHSLKAGDVVMVPAASKVQETPIDTQKFHIHIVKDGQTLYSISREYDVPIDLIEAYNPEIQNQIVKVGMRLLIPKNPRKAPSLPEDKKENHEEIPTGFHKVESGESLFSIARLYKLSVSELMNLNQLNDSILKIGQLIRVKNSTSSSSSNKVSANLQKSTIHTDSIRYTMHRVENGETLTSISKKYNIETADLLRFNPELNQMSLKTGMLLLIPIYIESASTIPDKSDKEDTKEILELSTIEAVNYFGMMGRRKLRVLLIIPANPENAGSDLKPTEIISMEYYLGVRTALELLQNEGYQIWLKVAEIPEKNSILAQISFDLRDYDLVIGPFIPQQIKELNQHLNGKSQLPIVLPFGQPSMVAPGNILLQETEELEARALSKALQSYYPEIPVYLIYSDKDQKANQFNDLLKKHLNGRILKEIRLGSSLQGLAPVTDSPDPKIISFFIDDNFLSSQFIDKIRKSVSSSSVLLLNRRILDNPLIEPRYLNQINFIVAVPRYLHLDHPLVKAAAENISSQYKLEPTDITLNAFQSTYDLIKTLTDNRHKPEFLELRSTRKPGVFQNAQIMVLTNRNYKLTPLPLPK